MVFAVKSPKIYSRKAFAEVRDCNYFLVTNNTVVATSTTG